MKLMMKINKNLFLINTFPGGGADSPPPDCILYRILMIFPVKEPFPVSTRIKYMPVGTV